jgi:VWFA-related protein
MEYKGLQTSVDFPQVVMKAAHISLFLLCFCVAFLAALSWGQESKQSTARDDKFTLKNDVNTVVVPVLVRNAQGREVGNLKQDDFQVFDNDKPQVISAFRIEKGAGVETPPAADATAVTPTAIAPPVVTKAASTPQRFLVFMFDDMHLSAEDMARAQKAATLLMGALSDSEIAAIVSTSGRVNSGLTHDRATLQESIAKLLPQGLYRAAGAECPEIDYYNGDLIINKHNYNALESAIEQVLSCNPNLDNRNVAERLAEAAATRAVTVGDQDARVTLSSIREYLRRMASLPGQCTLILISPGFLTITAESLSSESEIMDVAAQLHVTISALDARGLYVTELDASVHGAGSPFVMELNAENHRNSMNLHENLMAELADATGGTYFHNRNDLQAGLNRLAAAPDYLYLLYVSPKNVKQNGSYHRLKVKVDEPGLKVTARHGYFAAKPEKSKK